MSQTSRCAECAKLPPGAACRCCYCTLAAIVERKDRELSALAQKLETEKSLIARLREQVKDARHHLEDIAHSDKRYTEVGSEYIALCKIRPPLVRAIAALTAEADMDNQPAATGKDPLDGVDPPGRLRHPDRHGESQVERGSEYQSSPAGLFEGWVMIFQARDSRWNIAVPTFKSEEEAREYDLLPGYRIAHVREVAQDETQGGKDT